MTVQWARRSNNSEKKTVWAGLLRRRLVTSSNGHQERPINTTASTSEALAACSSSTASGTQSTSITLRSIMGQLLQVPVSVAMTESHRGEEQSQVEWYAKTLSVEGTSWENGWTYRSHGYGMRRRPATTKFYWHEILFSWYWVTSWVANWCKLSGVWRSWVWISRSLDAHRLSTGHLRVIKHLGSARAILYM